MEMSRREEKWGVKGEGLEFGHLVAIAFDDLVEHTGSDDGVGDGGAPPPRWNRASLA